MRLLLPFVFSLLASPLAAQTTEVLVGQGPRGARAFLIDGRGLVVRGLSGGAVRIGHGSEPRFDGAGNVWFTRIFDDGHEVTRTSTWVLERGLRTPRPARAGERAPQYVLPPRAGPAARVKVALDPGHGGSDPGAVGNGLLEKDINLDVARRLRDLLVLDTQDQRGGGEWDVLMTRTTDATVSLGQRTNAANAFGAVSFLAVHMNAFSSSSANGTETFCMVGQENNAGGRYRNRLQAEALAAWKLRDRGVKTASFYVLRNTRMPAALVEGGFITNPVDSQKMKDPAARERLALGLLWATQEHHGFKRYTPGAGGQVGTLRGVVYDAAKGTSARVAGATVALPDGRFVVADGAGAFRFQLPAGAWRYAATAPGFTAAELSRTVVVGQEVWGSLGLRAGNVPSLTGPTTPRAGATMFFRVQGDGGSPAVLLFAGGPGLPLVNLDALGLGILWPDLRTLLPLVAGAIPVTGVLAVPLPAPQAPGLTVHLQSLVLSQTRFRLGNGMAFQVQ